MSMYSGRPSYEVVAYAYEGGIHCEEHALKRFGPAIFDEEHPPVDRDGNEVQPVFLDEVGPEGLFCDDDGDVIEEPEEEEEDEEDEEDEDEEEED